MNRAERRRQSRAHAKIPVAFVGENTVVASLGEQFEAAGVQKMPGKIPGIHRWNIIAQYIVTEDELMKHESGADKHVLGPQNLVGVMTGCYDCERSYGEIMPGSHCPAKVLE